MEEQYLNLGKRLLEEGVWIENKRTGTRCLTLINADFEYDTSQGYLPLVTTRKAFWKPAISEMLGYAPGSGEIVISNKSFKKIGTIKTKY